MGWIEELKEDLKKVDDYIREGGWLDYLRRLKLEAEKWREEGIKFKPSKKVVKEKYIDYVRRGKIFELKGLYEITGIEPELPEDVVQEGYTVCVKRGWINELGELQEITGIKPLENIVQEGYVACIREGEIDKLERLRGITGIKPSEYVVQEAIFKILHYLSQGKTGF